MSKLEIKILDFFQKNVIIIGFIAVAIIAFFIRTAFFEVQSGDWQCFLNVWINQLNEYEGLKGIGQEIGEYNVLYMLFLNIVAKTSFNNLHEVKLLSVFFDYVCAYFILKILFKKKKEILSLKGLFVWSIALISPVSFLDSGYWAQCDGIYTAILLMCLYFLINEKHLNMMICFGIAFALKLQSVFFLPVIVIYYFASKKMSIKYVLAVPVVYFISIIPALIAGRGLSETLSIYTKQTDLYQSLTMNCPNLYYIISGDYEMFKKMGIFLTITVLGIGACYFILNKITSAKAYILLALWSSMVCVFFLPSMHERYAYISCIFAILWAFIYKKDWWIALLINLVCLISFTPYLFYITVIEFKHLSLINLALLVIVTIRIFTVQNEQNEPVKKVKIVS